MNPKVINLTTAVSELRTERSAADAQRFELKLLMARLRIVDTLLDITTKGAEVTERAQQRAAKVNSERI